MNDPSVIFIFSLILLVLIFSFLGIRKIPQSNAAVVERLGKYNRTLGAGINFIIPGLESINKSKKIYTIVAKSSTDGSAKKVYSQVELISAKGHIDLSEQLLDPEPINAIASDNAVLYPDIICHFIIIDPHKTLYNVNDLYTSMNSLLETTLRQSIGKMNSDEVISSRAVLGSEVKAEIEKASEPWGIRVTRVEIESISFDPEIQKRLAQAREAELVRRAEIIKEKEERDREILKAEARKQATILEAEGIKKAALLKAEGEKQAQIMEAEAQFESDKLRAEGEYLIESRKAEGEAKGIEALALAVQNNPDAIIALKAIEAQPQIAENLGDKAMIIPNEAVNIVGALGAVKTLWSRLGG